MFNLLTYTSEQILGIISGVVAGVVAIIAAVGKVINENRKKTCENPKCCITGRDLKKSKKNSKEATQKKA